MSFKLFLASTIAAQAVLCVSTPVFAASLDELVAAAKAEGKLTTIALPHDWCGYGAVIEGFCSQTYADIDVQGLFEGK